MFNVLTPFVYWAQTENKINLKVDLKYVKDINVYVDNKKLKFFACGQGARGLNNYGFYLDFYSTIDPDESYYKVKDKHIDFVLIKKLICWWPRLIGQQQKPSWLKIDYDNWKTKDNDIDNTARDISLDYPDLYDQLYAEECGYRKEDLKKVYLIFYNLFQCIGFMYIFFVMGIKYYRDGPDSMKDTYETVGNPMKFIQILQFLEVLHPLFGYTAMWTMVEVIRYSYYITHLLHTEISTLTWLRYTIWMPLYPLGFVCEGIIVLRNIPYFEETGKFTVNLPNSWNFAFHFPTFMRVYLLVFCIPGMCTMMSYMKKIRSEKLSKQKIRRRNS